MKRSTLAVAVLLAVFMAGCSQVKPILCTIVPVPGICETPCPGDCNGDGEVTADELTTITLIGLGQKPLSECTAADANGDGSVSAAERSAAQAAAESGCPK